MRATHLRTRHLAATACLVAVAALAACTSDADAEPSPTSATVTSPAPTSGPTPTPSPTTSVDPAVAEAEDAILEAYRGYWAAKVQTLATPDQTEPLELSYYSVDRALGAVRGTLDAYRVNGIVNVGEPTTAPAVADIVLDGDSSTAKIHDCVDVSNWQPVYVGDGSSAAAPGQKDRIVSESDAMIFEGHWVIWNSLAFRDMTC